MPRQYTRIPPAERFWKHVNKTDSCWLWTGGKNAKGHGSFMLAPGKHIGAHRFSYELAYGPVPDDLFVCHNCPGGDNPSCVNPAHLWLGTNQDNVQDAIAKGQIKTGAQSWPTNHRYRAPRGEQHWSHRNPAKVTRGERTGAAKLTWPQVREIRARYTAGGISQRALALGFGVTVMTISRIVLCQTWLEDQ